MPITGNTLPNRPHHGSPIPEPEITLQNAANFLDRDNQLLKTVQIQLVAFLHFPLPLFPVPHFPPFRISGDRTTRPRNRSKLRYVAAAYRI
jgi:hypothetical protein